MQLAMQVSRNFFQTTRGHIPENNSFHSHCGENSKFHNRSVSFPFLSRLYSVRKVEEHGSVWVCSSGLYAPNFRSLWGRKQGSRGPSSPPPFSIIQHPVQLKFRGYRDFIAFCLPPGEL